MKKTFAILAGIVCLTAGVARADYPDELTDPFYAMQNPKRLLRGAELTDAQVAEILRVRRTTEWEREKQVVKERDELWRQFDELYAGTAAALDEQKLLELFEKAQKLTAEEERLKAQVMIKMRALLTPEQLKRVVETHRAVRLMEQAREELETGRKALPPTIASEQAK